MKAKTLSETPSHQVFDRFADIGKTTLDHLREDFEYRFSAAVNFYRGLNFYFH